jgi:hypothetical protein
MRDALAERLLAQVLGWSPGDIARERPALQAMADHKYDEYQQFSPGMRFVESLAVWLNKFETKEERDTAYNFIKTRLVFISEAEMRHLVSLAYPDVIRPILMKEAALLLSLPEFQVTKIASSIEFSLLRRRSIFLGLSDGARMDCFRRVSGLNNEQIHVDYRIEEKTASEMGAALRKDVKALTGDSKIASKALFEMVFLLNDFAGSGDTLLRQENGEVKGKVAKAMEKILTLQSTPPLINAANSKVIIILYVATKKAIDNLKERLLSFGLPDWPACEVGSVYPLSEKVRVNPTSEPKFDAILQKYYDPSIMDPHLAKGGPDVIYGYGGCALPLVLAHNTPNNSLYLLWANKPELRTCALFPRISRHREDT